METLSVKGHEIKLKRTKSAYHRHVVLFANKIVEELKQLGFPRDDISIETRIPGNKNEPAVVEFWGKNEYLRFSFSRTKRFVDNLYIIKELIHIEVEEVLSGRKTMHQFIETFSEKGDRKEISKELKNAKLTLGLDEDEDDLDKINNAYRDLAKKHHPDAGGDMNEFQKINKAHKLIKKEMGA